MRVLVTLALLLWVHSVAPVGAVELVPLECQAGDKPYPTDAYSKLLVEVQDQYREVNSMHARFEQLSYLAALDISEESAGEVWYERPGRVRWDYNQPEEQVALIKERELWLYQPEQSQVLLESLEEVFLSDLPVSFILGLGDLPDTFTLRAACRSDSGKLLVLDPKRAPQDEVNSVREMRLLVDHEGAPRVVQVTDSAGNITAITLVDRTLNPVISENRFEVAIPDGIDVIDRRRIGSFDG